MNDVASRLGIKALRSLVLIVTLFAASQEVWADQLEARKIERGEFSFLLGPAPDWVVPMSVASDWPADAPGASGARWRNWLVDDQAFRVQGRRVRYYDRAYEALSAELLTEIGKFETQYSPEYQTLTFHEVSLRRSGTWQDRFNPDRITLARRESEFESDMATGTVSAMVLLDDVRTGDVVRIRYSIEGENPILAGFDSDSARFAWSDPVLDQQFRVLFDADESPMEFRDPRIPKADIRKTAHHLEWRYAAHATAAMTDEGSYPHWHVAFPFVNVTEKRSWRDVARWALKLYPEPKALPPDLVARINEWRQLPSLDAKVTAALGAVQEDIRYFGVEIGANTHRPAEPSDVWTLRRGDCKDKSRLLVTILQAMGIKANPALVNAQLGKAIADFPPAASQFDHVIVQVHDGSRSLWLDPTQTQQRGPASAQDIGDFGVALPIAATSKSLVTVERNPGFVDNTTTHERIELDNTGNNAELEVRTEYAGAAANRMRYELAISGAEALSRRYEDFYRRRFGEASVKETMLVHDDPEKNHLIITERYRLAEPWSASSSSQRSIDFYADQIGSAVSLPKTLARTMPLAMRYPHQNLHRFEVRLPKGWQWSGKAEQQAIEDQAAHFSTRQGEQDGFVFVEQKYDARSAVVETDRMAEHLRWRRKVGEAVSPRLVLILPSADAARAQNDRLNNLIRDVMRDNRTRAKPGKDND